jgi:hypothetical protein
MEAKYLIVESRGLELPIVFNSIIDHSQIASAFAREHILSAGKCSSGDSNQWQCYGKSVTLNLESRQCDARILNTKLQMEV